MSTVTPVQTAVVPPVFQDPNGLSCSPAAYCAPGITLQPQALITLVSSQGPLGVPYIWGQYRHVVTKQAIDAKHLAADPGYCLQPPTDDSSPSLEILQEFVRWNDPALYWA
jgi:hypothetical protein